MAHNEDELDLSGDVIAEIKRDFLEVSLFEKNLQEFCDAYQKEFSQSVPKEKGAADALVFALFTHVIAMSCMGFGAHGLVEMNAILESFSRREIVGHISNARGTKIVEALVDRQSLDSMAHSLRELGMLTDDDVRLSSKLTQLRNGLAHRNDKPIRELMRLPKDVGKLDVWYMASQVDWIPYQLGSIRFLVHLSGKTTH